MAIATGTALAIAALSSAGTSAYATKRSGDINRRALKAQETSDERAQKTEWQRMDLERQQAEAALSEEKRWREEQAALQREESSRKERLYNEAVTRDRERYQEYLRAWQPHWQAGAGVLNNLYDIAGYKGQQPNPAAAAASMPLNTPPPSPSPTDGGGFDGRLGGGTIYHPPGTRIGGAPSDGGYDGSGIAAGRTPMSSTMPVSGRSPVAPMRRGSVLPRPEMPSPRAMSLTDLMALNDFATKYAPSAAPALYQGF